MAGSRLIDVASKVTLEEFLYQMFLRILDVVLGVLLREDFQDEAIGDLWEFSHALQRTRKYKLERYVLILKRACSLIFASFQISLDSLQDRQLPTIRKFGKFSLLRRNLDRLWLKISRFIGRRRTLHPTNQPVVLHYPTPNESCPVNTEDYKLEIRSLCELVGNMSVDSDSKEIVQQCLEDLIECKERQFELKMRDQHVKKTRNGFVLALSTTIFSTLVFLLGLISMSKHDIEFSMREKIIQSTVAIFSGAAALTAIGCTGKVSRDLRNVKMQFGMRVK
ncbi:hypothetical protein IQ266_26590 [filamentous cyanobacterium LEGE 11480]|uniref:Uncharacterized protein n=1 Tax=Romeriopsis navalis LEGE 11480 TaxID=2777977 RepID=A0A928VRH9_9CYAN|nr:hypothetical protein [Romeriopsis navalis]MBE9033306.1 hypothetical protein [Romeriopsis navalis LEGE 11480]